MPENIIDNEMMASAPFEGDPARALARRGERLLAAGDLADQVALLAPLEAYYVVRGIGLDQALPILLQLSEEQLEGCIDLDCWNRHDFSVDTLAEWLAAYAHAGAEALATAFLSLDHVVQLLFLAQTVTVYDPDTDQVPPEDRHNVTLRAMTPDGFYLLELKSDIPLKLHPFSLLDALYQYDPTVTHQLLSEIRVDLPTQIEEEALRFRNGRMEDIGFVPPDEAVLLFSRPSSGRPLPRPRKPIETARTGMPAVYAASLSGTSLLRQALARLADPEQLSRLEQEIVWVINGAIIAYGEKTQDIQQIINIAERVRDTISLGLESLLGQQEPDDPPKGAAAAAKAADLLDILPVIDLFRHGFAATLELQREVRQALREPRFRAWYDLADTEQSDEPADRLERAFVAALLGRHPLRGGFDPAGAEKVKAFGCRAEVDVARLRLERLVARIMGA